MKRSPAFFALLFAGLFFAFSGTAVQAQQVPAAVITGTVVDAETGTPLAGAHVFIAESMIGTTTDGDGRYRLERVPLGAHRLYASIIGFEPAFRDIMLRESRSFTFDFQMNESVAELDGITVEAQGDKRWKRRLQRFTKIFVGETPNSRDTKILNPEVLDFADKGGTLLAFANDIIQIENKALGYRIQYFLKDFKAEPSRIQYDGEPLYEEMTPESPEQAAMWEENRRKAFYGSFRHFMLAAISGKAKEHGFETFQRATPAGAAGQGTFERGSAMNNQRVPFDVTKLLKDTDNPNEKLLELDGAIELIFKGELESKAYVEWQKTFGGPGGIRGDRYQKSLFWQENGPTLVDYKGDILNPYGVTVSGHLAFERVADELPKEYRPSR
ncbi:MAG: carboxypeptidase-like regulatory domain-containing protein [Bacteroidota bacterium]